MLAGLIVQIYRNSRIGVDTNTLRFCVTLDKLLNLSELSFPHSENEVDREHVFVKTGAEPLVAAHQRLPTLRSQLA